MNPATHFGSRPASCRQAPRLMLGALPLVLLLAFFQGGGNQASAAEPLVVFLVRHAEKLDGTLDSDLSPAGVERAEALSSTLRDARIEQVHSSNFLRTRRTAEPTARRLQLELKLYDRLKPAALVSNLRKAGGRHLVVGHSNTIPDLVKLLGGDPGTPIDESTEFDRLYVVTIDAAGRTTTLLLHYGRSSPPPAG